MTEPRLMDLSFCLLPYTQRQVGPVLLCFTLHAATCMHLDGTEKRARVQSQSRLIDFRAVNVSTVL